MANPSVPLSQRHAFLSYVHEDKQDVDLLQEALEAAGIAVWRDTKDLWPGQDWEMKIRAAIKADALVFLACFSANSEGREKSYQNAELALAVDEFRLRPPNTEWLIPVRFGECEVPEYNLGAGRTLSSLQRTDLFGPSQMVQTIRLVEAVRGLVNPAARVAASIAEGIAAERAADSPRAAQTLEIKSLLRDPNGDIMLEDLAFGIAKSLKARFNDEADFPVTPSGQHDEFEFARYWIGQMRRYETEMEPAFSLVTLGAMYGLSKNEPTWTRFMQTIDSTTQQRAGRTSLLQLRDYPLVALMQTAAIAAMSRNNYGALRSFVADPKHRLDSTTVPVVLYTGQRRVTDQVEWIASALCLAEEGEREVTLELLAGLRNRSIGSRHTPLSDHLFSLLRPVFDDYFSDEDEYADAFDDAEVLIDAIANDARTERAKNFWGGGRFGYGRYTWRHVHSENTPESKMLESLDHAGAGWSPLLGGLFGGSKDRARAALETTAENANAIRRSQW